MYVIKRTVGTGIVIGENSDRINLTLVGIDWLGGCALIDIEMEGETKANLPHEMGAGEFVYLSEDVKMHMLRLSRASHEGIPAQVVEFGFEAPRVIPIKRTEDA